MDPRIIRKILEGYTDEVGVEVSTDDDRYANTFCPRCSGNCRKSGPGPTILNAEPIPQFNLECLSCGCVFSPRSGLIVEMGNLGLLEPPEYLIG